MPVDVMVDGVDTDPEPVRADAERALQVLGREADELSVVLCDDATMQPLNLEWRDIDAPTDVLSFPQDADADAPVRMLGDIVISVDTAARQAAELGHGLDTELRVLLVHGLCHLLGHDHHDDAQAATMRAEEQRLLAALGEGASGLVDRAST